MMNEKLISYALVAAYFLFFKDILRSDDTISFCCEHIKIDAEGINKCLMVFSNF